MKNVLKVLSNFIEFVLVSWNNWYVGEIHNFKDIFDMSKCEHDWEPVSSGSPREIACENGKYDPNFLWDNTIYFKNICLKCGVIRDDINKAIQRDLLKYSEYLTNKIVADARHKKALQMYCAKY